MKRSFTLLLSGAILSTMSAQSIDVAFLLPEMQSLNGDIEATTTSDGGVAMAYCRLTDTFTSVLEVAKTGPNGELDWRRSIDLQSGLLEDLHGGVVCAVNTYNDGVMVLVNGYTNDTAYVEPAWNLVQVANDGALERVVRVYYPGSQELGGEYNYSSTFLTRTNGHVLLNISSYGRVVLTELDENLSAVWSHSFVATEDTLYPKEPSFDIQFTTDSGCIIVGKDRDWPFLMKVDAQGNAQWCNSYIGMGSYSHWRFVRTLANGELIVLGSTDSQALIARFDAAGNMLACSSINGMTYVDNVVDLPDGSYLIDDGYAVQVRVAQDGTVLEASTMSTWAFAPFRSLFHNGEVVRTFAMTSNWPEYHVAMESHALSDPQGCSAVTMLSTSSNPLPYISGYVPTPGYFQYMEPVVLTDMPLLSSLSELTLTSACGLFVGVTEPQQASARLYPVPVQAGATLQVELTEVRSTTTYEILDPMGRIVAQGSNGPSPLLTIPTQGLVAGAYLLRVTSWDQALAAQRFVVE